MGFYEKSWLKVFSCKNFVFFGGVWQSICVVTVWVYTIHFFFCLFLNKSIKSIRLIILNYRNTQLHKRTISPLSSTNSLISLKISQHSDCESLWAREKNGKSPIALAFSFEKVSAWRSTQACSFVNPLPASVTRSNWFLRSQWQSSLSSPWNSNQAEKIAMTIIGWLSGAFMAAKQTSFGFLILDGSGYLILQVWVFSPLN